MQAQWTCIVLAGQRPGKDPLAAHFGMEWKALVPLNGEAMITHVLRTLHRCEQISQIIVLSQEPEVLRGAIMAGGGAQTLVSGSGISASISAVAGRAAAPWPVLLTTADHPLLTEEMVSEFLQSVDADVAVAMVEEKTMRAQFPDARRTWLRFADGSWSGANLFALTSDRATAALTLWADAEQDRKKAWKLFLHFGPVLAFRAITRTIGLRDALKKAGVRLGLSAQLVSMSDPVAAIDVDKIGDHDLAQAITKERTDLAQGGSC